MRFAPSVKFHTEDPTLEPLYKQAVEHYQNEKFKEAHNLVTEILSRNPRHLATLELWGVMCDSKNNFQGALNAFQTILKEKPELVQINLNIGQALLRLEKYGLAIKHLEKGLESHKTAAGYIALGQAYLFMNDKEKARAAFDNAIDVNPQSASAIYSIINYIEKPKDENNRYHQALLKIQEDTLVRREKISLHAGLFKSYEGMKKYDLAFEHALKGAKIQREVVQYDADAHSDWTDRVIAYFSKSLFEANRLEGCESERPVFILAMPRSGTTLVEQILQAHPDVKGMGEHPFLSSLIERKSFLQTFEETPYPLRKNTGEDYLTLAAIADIYIRFANKRAGENRKRVIDKSMMNRIMAGALALAFPHARFIYVERHAVDCCLSTFTTSFLGGVQPYSYDLRELGQHYKDHWRLMNHWKDTFGDRILHVRYEDLVDYTEKVAREMIDFINLKWDDKCLKFHENKGAVNTASATQVREPIHKKSVARWKHYETQLAPLIKALGESAPEDAKAGIKE